MGPLDVDPERSDQRSWLLSDGTKQREAAAVRLCLTATRSRGGEGVSERARSIHLSGWARPKNFKRLYIHRLPQPPAKYIRLYGISKVTNCYRMLRAMQ